MASRALCLLGFVSTGSTAPTRPDSSLLVLDPDGPINTMGGLSMKSRHPLNQCPSGLPQNITVLSTIGDGVIARDWAGANAALDLWLNHARGKGCVNASVDVSIDEESTVDMVTGNALVSMRHNVAFMWPTLADVASHTVNVWMDCRFGATQRIPKRLNPIALTMKPTTYRATLLREPASRARSGFFQILSHYTMNVRMGPDDLAMCTANLPDGRLTKDADCNNLPQMCKDAWLTTALSGDDEKHCTMRSISKPMLEATSETFLLRALWQLPCSCRSMHSSTTNGADEYREYGCPTSDTKATCELDDLAMAQLFSHALSDAAKQDSFGCGQETYGGEHMHSFMPNLYDYGRNDLPMRLESVNDEAPRFEEWLTNETGTKFQKLEENCTFADPLGNAGLPGFNEALFNPDHLKDAFTKSVDLQRRTCFLFWADYVCAAYPLPEACRNPDLWMDDTIQRITDNAPVVMD